MSSIIELFSDADDAFFERIMTNSEHVLQKFLPENLICHITLKNSQSIIDNKNHSSY